MTSRQRSFLVATALTLGSVLLFWTGRPAEAPVLSTPDPAVSPTPANATPGTAADASPQDLAPAGVPDRSENSNRSQRHFFAMAAHEIAGLPRDVDPGTQIELWVTWDRPITKTPQLHRLDSDVILEEIVPPASPAEAAMVLLSVRAHRISNLIWAERYGALSAVLLGPSS